MKTKLVIFGITGDLSTRKLLPALRHIVSDEPELSIIGVSRREVNVPELVGPELADITTVFTMDLANADDYSRLHEFVALNDDEQLLIYLSVPPSAAADIVDFLGLAGLNTPNVKLLFEKPFGFDFESAREYLERTATYFNEDQIYRIDHYMAKEVAQTIIGLRKDAAMHHHTWGAHSIESVEVVASETLGVEDRAFFYEQTGALRDFLQGHLMQLLSLVLMEAPDDFDQQKLAEYRLGALELLQPADPAEAVRAQYEGYQADVENPGSLTETFASLLLKSNDPNWAEVPLRLTTGKELNEKRSAVVIHYRDATVEEFDEDKVVVEGRKLDAYERVLIEAIAGHKTIFTTGPEVLRSWQIVAPVQTDWENDDTTLKQYAKGSTINEVSSNPSS